MQKVLSELKSMLEEIENEYTVPSINHINGIKRHLEKAYKIAQQFVTYKQEGDPDFMLIRNLKIDLELTEGFENIGKKSDLNSRFHDVRTNALTDIETLMDELPKFRHPGNDPL